MPFGRTCEEQLAFRRWADARGGDMKLYGGSVIQEPGTPDRWSHGTLNESIGMAAVGASPLGELPHGERGRHSGVRWGYVPGSRMNRLG